jgi:hypothetical protein
MSSLEATETTHRWLTMLVLSGGRDLLSLPVGLVERMPWLLFWCGRLYLECRCCVFWQNRAVTYVIETERVFKRSTYDIKRRCGYAWNLSPAATRNSTHIITAHPHHLHSSILLPIVASRTSKSSSFVSSRFNRLYLTLSARRLKLELLHFHFIPSRAKLYTSKWSCYVHSC